MITDTFNNILRYKKGLFRVWVVLSAIWVIFIIIVDYGKNSNRNKKHNLFNSLSDYKYCSYQTYKKRDVSLLEFNKKLRLLKKTERASFNFWIRSNDANLKYKTKPHKHKHYKLEIEARQLGWPFHYFFKKSKRSIFNPDRYLRYNKREFACSPQERLLEKAKIIFLPPLFLLLGVTIFLITIPLIFTYFLSPIFSWVSSGFAEKEVNEESKSMKIKKEIAITYPLSSKNKGKQSRWLSVVHLIGGGALFNVFEISYILPDLGAIPTVLLLGIGYFGSYVLISNLWKKVTKKNYRIAVGVILCLVYVIIAALLAWFIDQVLF